MKKYEQVAQDLRDSIASGNYEHGENIPSIRTLSELYHCSKSTILRALTVLVDEHILYAKAQSGYYVANNFTQHQGLHEGIRLDSGNPVINSFSTTNIKHLLSTTVDLYANHSRDVTKRGFTSLVNLLPSFLAEDSVYANEKNIFLIQGITQILSFLTQASFPNGKQTILVEEPTYVYYLDFLRTLDVRVLTIPRTEHGLDLKLLEHYFEYEDIKFFYTIPRNHNPLGTVLDYWTRRKIMDLAIKYNVYIVEDDYFGGNYRIPKYVPIHYFSYSQNCIYLRSFTKEFPLIRLGICVVPDGFITTFQTIAEESYFYSYHMPDLVSQATFETYLKTSIQRRHAEETSIDLARKLTFVRQTLNAWKIDGIKLIGAESGYYFTIQFDKEKILAKKVVVELERRNVFIKSNINAYFYPEHFDNSIRISISKVSMDDLSAALQILYQLIIENNRMNA